MAQTRLFHIAAAVVLVFVGTAQSLCELELSCSSCLGQSGCGWAADMTQCYPGTSTGPNFPFTSSNWKWGTSASCGGSGGNTGGTCGGYSTCSGCITNANCEWDGLSCISGSNIGSVCWGGNSFTGITDEAAGMSFGIIMVVVFVPVAVVGALVSFACVWYRRTLLARRVGAVVVADCSGLGVSMQTPYVSVQTGPVVNSVVY